MVGDRVRAAVAKLEADVSPAAGVFRVTIGDDAPRNTRGLDRVFDGMGATIDDLPRILESAVPTIREAHAAVFTSEGAAGRGSWQALAPRTVRERVRLGYPGSNPILVRTGALRDHVLSTPAVVSRKGNTVELRIAPAREVDGVPKYRALARGFGAIPARPMVALGPSAAARVTSTIVRAFRARAAANGLR